MTAPDTADLSATLAGIRERAETASTYYEWHQVGRDNRLAVAALEAALKLADDFDAEAARLLATAARLNTGSATGTQNRAWAHRDCAEALRTRITAALTGEEADR